MEEVMRILNLILLSLLLTLLLSSCGPIFKTVEIKGESMSNYYSRNANNYSNKASIYYQRVVAISMMFQLETTL